MRNLFLRTLFAVALTACALPTVLLAQTADYNKVIAQAKADLTAGHNAEALAGGQKAIQMDSSRWEAYLVVGAALQNQSQFDLAIDNYSKAMERAPEAKKIGVRTVLEQCMREKLSAPSSPAALPSFQNGPGFDETMALVRSQLPKTASAGAQSVAQYFPDRVRPDGTPNPFPECQAELVSAAPIDGKRAMKGLEIRFSDLPPNGITVKSFGEGILQYQEISGLSVDPHTPGDIWTAIVMNDPKLAGRIAMALNHVIDVCGRKGISAVSAQQGQSDAVDGSTPTVEGGATSAATFKETLDWLTSKNDQEGISYSSTEVQYYPPPLGTQTAQSEVTGHAGFFRSGPCRAEVRGSATNFTEVVDFSTSTPNSIRVKALDVHKVGGEGTDVIAGINDVIKVTSAHDMYFQITGLYIDSAQSKLEIDGPGVAPVYYDHDVANRVAKALNHAIDVCGGKAKSEAF